MKQLYIIYHLFYQSPSGILGGVLDNKSHMEKYLSFGLHRRAYFAEARLVSLECASVIAGAASVLVLLMAVAVAAAGMFGEELSVVVL